MPEQLITDVTNIAIVIGGLWLSGKIKHKSPTISLLVKIFFVVLSVVLSLGILLRSMTFEVKPSNQITIEAPALIHEMEITV